MTFLPIVGRELRVASRRKATYHTRRIAALIGLIVTALFLFIESKAGFGFSLGSQLFMTLTWMSFIFVCFAGVFLTSDAVSEERREGTLGLLFLTDLKGYDVVIGKLLSNSLQSFYGLLAVFPVMALPLLMGGVTGSDFWRMMLVLVNGLFFSLAAGIFVSSINRDSQKALRTTFILVAIVIVGLPLLASIDHWLFKPASILSIASPGFAFLNTMQKNYQAFWAAIFASNLLGWIFVGLASYYTPRVWQEKATGTNAESKAYSRRFGSASERSKLRLRLMDLNPVYWLIARERLQGFLLRIILLITLVIIGFLFLTGSSSGVGFSVTRGFLSFASFCFQIWITSQAARFFAEGWRTGSLELLLCSPLTVREIIQGQWLALRRLFLFPAVLILLAQAMSGIVQMRFFQNLNTSQPLLLDFHLINLMGSLVNLVSGLVALSWVGMWMGLTTKKPAIAVAKSFLFVHIIPWFGLIIVQMFLSFRFWIASGPATIPLILAIITLGKDIGFVLWARARLHSELREIVAMGGRVRRTSPIVSMEAPPVISNPAKI